MRFFSILLKSDKKRVKHVFSNLMKNIPDLEIFPAIEGKTNELEFYLDEREINPKYLKFCKRGELACLLSHVSLWEKMILDNIEEAVIFEDDAVVEEAFLDSFYSLYNELPSNADFLYLFVDPNSKKSFVSSLTSSLSPSLIKGFPTYGTVGYYITKKMAGELIEMFADRINDPLDVSIDRYLKEYFKNYYCVSVNIVNRKGKLNKNDHESAIDETGFFSDPNTLIYASFYIDQGDYLCYPCCDLGDEDDLCQDEDHTLKKSKEKYLNDDNVVAFNNEGWIKKSLNNWYINPTISLFVKSDFLKRKSAILLTGGCGYIGSHCLLEILLTRSEDIVIIDNLKNSTRDNMDKIKGLGNVFFYNINLKNKYAIDDVFFGHNIQTVIYFDGYKSVGKSVGKSVEESIKNPLKYYSNNIGGLINLLKCMKKHNVNNIIFSSSETVYGDNSLNSLTEDSSINNLNPRTKHFSEEILKDLKDFNVVVLRYFNPVGVHSFLKETEGDNLFHRIVSLIKKEKEVLNIYGGDYSTPDGTDIGHYIHIIDLAKGHLAALEYIDLYEGYEVFNLRTGIGYSVLDIVKEFSKYCEIPYKIVERREGDAYEIYSDCKKSSYFLNWKAELSLEDMVKDSLTFLNIKNKIKFQMMKRKNKKETILTEKWLEKQEGNIEKYSELFKMRDENKISKIFHFIWIGNNKIPDIYVDYIKTWIRHHGDWKFCLWTDSNIPNLILSEEYKNAEKFAMKADILRYELLYIFGGVYVDCDFICYKNIEKIIENLKGFSAWESKDFIAIGLMGFIPGNPFLADVIRQIKVNCNSKLFERNEINKITGPIMFTKLYKSKLYEDVLILPESFCYPFTYQDSYYKKRYIRNYQSYAVHMWGNSWGASSSLESKSISTSLSNSLTSLENLNYLDLKKKEFIYLKKNENVKIKVLHIMGIFFSGGIERLLNYFDKYGNFDKFEYYLLYIPYLNNEKFYKIENMRTYSYEVQEDIPNLIYIINPDLIVDHVSLYFQNNAIMYENYDRNKVIAFVHSAIKYNIDVKPHNFNNCIHLYNEINKHVSWNNIKNNYYVTLGTECVQLEDSYFKDVKYLKEKIKIGLIGRISQEKFPLLFLEKLNNFSLNQIFEINIYGEKDNVHGGNYNNRFDSIIKSGNIKYHGFINSNKIGEIYKQLDILIIPSEYETGSFTCIEALNYGVVVIARNVYGMKYIIDKGFGYLCDSDEEIINVLKNIDIFEISKKSILSYEVSKKYDIKQQIKNIENIFIKKNFNLIFR